MPFIGKQPTAVPLTSSDITDGIVTSAKIADGTIVNADVNASAAIDGSKLSGAGISMAQTYRLTADTAGSQNPITALEAVDSDSPGSIGSSMSVSSGIFTFPSTGIYFMSAFASALYTGSIRYCRLDLEVTTDNSTYTPGAQSYGHINNVSSSTFTNMGACNFIFDVTNTSTHKARLSFTPDNESTTLRGNTDHNSTAITFIRLGDT